MARWPGPGIAELDRMVRGSPPDASCAAVVFGSFALGCASDLYWNATGNSYSLSAQDESHSRTIRRGGPEQIPTAKYGKAFS